VKFFLILILFVSSQLFGQISKDELEVTYTYNFARNVTWPNEANLRSFNITLIGGNRELSNKFQALTKSARLKNGPITFRQINDLANLQKTQLIFVAKNKHALIPQIFEKIEGLPVLLVTNDYANKRLVMINLIEKNRQISFEINKANIINNKLKTKPELVLSGGTEIDVAKLFREGQQSLAALGRKVRLQESQLKGLKVNILKSESLLSQHEIQIKTQQTSIDQQEKELIGQQKKIKTQQLELSARKSSLSKLEVEINASREELLTKTAKNTELVKNQKKLNTEIEQSRETISTQENKIKNQRELLAKKIAERDKLISDISTKVTDLANLKGEFDQQKGEVKKRELQINDIRASIAESMKVLDNQQSKIDSQATVLESQVETIATQQNVLSLLWFVVILITALIGSVTWAYLHKRKVNNALQIREKDLGEALSNLKDAQGEIIEARNDALSASRSKSEFLANMSHEIRTPMNAILGFSDLLKRRISTEKEKKFLSSIESSGRSLLRLINDILDLSKVEAGKIELEYADVNAKNIFQELHTVFANKLSRKNLNFIVDIDKSLPPTLILDETRLRQVLFNLIGNAIKFTEEGQVKVSVRSERRIDNASQVNLLIDVADSGIGVPDDQKERIFGAFDQQSGQSNAKYGGTGLGLAISRKLVELMQGTIKALDNDDGGATFAVELSQVDVCTTITTDLETNLEVPRYNFLPAKILITDDIPINRELIISYLYDFNFTIFEAENGLEAIEVAKKELPDFIFMDMKMPVMNGYEAATLLKEDPVTANIPIIAVTASAMKQSEKEILNYCNGYLRKPVSQSILINELAKFLAYEESDFINGKEKKSSKVLKFKVPQEVLVEIQPHLETLKMGLSTDAVMAIISCLNNYPENEDLRELSKQLQSHLDHFDLEGISYLLEKCI
jgi:signal transduction histidine kinase/DNA-binding NarL/FixJ family response regulator